MNPASRLMVMGPPPPLSLPDINHPSESCHCCGYIKQLSQTHRFTTFISSKYCFGFLYEQAAAEHMKHGLTSLCVLFSPQGKVVHQSYSIQSSFTQKVRLQQIRSLTKDIRFYYKRLRNNKDELEPRRKSKVSPSACRPVSVSCARRL